MNAIKKFDIYKIRCQYNPSEKQWYFSVKDIVEAATGSLDPAQTIQNHKSRKPAIKSIIADFCKYMPMESPTGYKSRVLAGNKTTLSMLLNYFPTDCYDEICQWMDDVNNQAPITCKK